MIGARTITVRESPGEQPYLLTWQTQGRFQLRYFAAYLAATNMLEVLNERGILARLYAELTIETQKREAIEEPIPPGVSREAYERSKELARYPARRLHRG